MGRRRDGVKMGRGWGWVEDGKKVYCVDYRPGGDGGEPCSDTLFAVLLSSSTPHPVTHSSSHRG